MKKILLLTAATSFLIFGTIQSGFAKPSCKNDAAQMRAQITARAGGSISTGKCNAFIHQIQWNARSSNSNRGNCQATCLYLKDGVYTGGKTTCFWRLGNWGNTLNCTPRW